MHVKIRMCTAMDMAKTNQGRSQSSKVNYCRALTLVATKLFYVEGYPLNPNDATLKVIM